MIRQGAVCQQRQDALAVGLRLVAPAAVPVLVALLPRRVPAGAIGVVAVQLAQFQHRALVLRHGAAPAVRAVGVAQVVRGVPAAVILLAFQLGAVRAHHGEALLSIWGRGAV